MVTYNGRCIEKDIMLSTTTFSNAIPIPNPCPSLPHHTMPFLTHALPNLSPSSTRILLCHTVSSLMQCSTPCPSPPHTISQTMPFPNPFSLLPYTLPFPINFSSMLYPCSNHPHPSLTTPLHTLPHLTLFSTLCCYPPYAHAVQCPPPCLTPRALCFR